MKRRRVDMAAHQAENAEVIGQQLSGNNWACVHGNVWSPVRSIIEGQLRGRIEFRLIVRMGPDTARMLSGSTYLPPRKQKP